MANNTKKLYEQALSLIESKRLIFIEDVVAYLPITKQTFYTYFPVDSDELDAIKDLIDKNKVNIKVGLRQKMYKSNSPTDRAMLYKLVGTDEERTRLNKTEIQHSGEVHGINVVAPTDEDRDILRRLDEFNTDPTNKK